MNLCKSASRGLILPAFLAASVASPAFAVPGTSKQYNYTGSVAAVCKIGTSTSYAVSIVVTASNGMIKLDGNVGNIQSTNNQATTVTVDYSAICNQATQKILTLNAPQAISGSNNIAYTFTVKNQANGGGTTVATVNAEPGSTSVIIPANTNATWSIVVTATYKNSLTAGTYNATVTIQ